MNINYHELVKKSKNPLWIAKVRRMMILHARKHGIKPTAKYCKVSKNTVKKWLKEYDNGNYKLLNKTNRPNHMPNRIDQYWEFEIISNCQKLNKLNKRFTAGQIQNIIKSPYSVKTVRKVMKNNGFAKTNKKKTERKRDMREAKLKYKAFEKLQVDVKYLDDIPEFYSDLKQYNIPKYQYTARCIRTGALFFCFAREKTITNSIIFIRYVLGHLKRYGIHPKIVQTDNGFEFIHNWQMKDESLFTQAIKKYKCNHILIPPGAKTWQSDVESSHRLIEDEFYSFQYFENESAFYFKAAAYQKYFNLKRKNSYKNNMSPKEIIQKIRPYTRHSVLLLKPLVLDKLLNKLYFTVAA